MHVQSLHIYPVKGARGIDVNNALLNLRGFAHDRRWVVTDDKGVFLTQRECSALARLIATPDGDSLKLESKDMEGSAQVKVAPGAERETIRVWRDDIDAADVGVDAAGWLSEALGRPARLFFMDDRATRTTSGQMASSAPVSFADGYPVLIVTAASLGALNEEIAASGGDAVPMARFRPNVVIDGAAPWGDDYWKAVKIGGVTFDLVKPCDRCVVTTKDQASGASMGKEPLKSLARIRRSADPRVNGVLFGWNAIPRNEGDISVGDSVQVVEERPEGWPLAPIK